MTLEEVKRELLKYGFVRQPGKMYRNRVSVRLKEDFDVRVNAPPELKLQFFDGMQPNIIEAGQIGEVDSGIYASCIFNYEKECPVKFSQRCSIIGVPWELLEIVS